MMSLVPPSLPTRFYDIEWQAMVLVRTDGRNHIWCVILIVILSSYMSRSKQIGDSSAALLVVPLCRSYFKTVTTLQWRHNGRDGVSNHQPHDCLLSRIFRRGSKKTSKPRVTGLCVGNLSVDGEFPAQMASNAVNVMTSSYKWKYHWQTGSD